MVMTTAVARPTSTPRVEHNEDHHAFVATDAARGQHYGTDHGAEGLGDHNLGEDFGVAHADADQPVGRNLKEAVDDAPHDGVDEDALVGFGDGEIFVDVNEVGFNGGIGEQLTLAAEGEGVHNGVDGGGGEFGEPGDAFAAAGDDDDDGEGRPRRRG